MKQKKEKRFIETFERNIKYIRKEHYKKIATNPINENLLFIENTIKLIPYIFSILLIIIFDFKPLAYFIAIISSVIYTIICEIYMTKTEMKEKNKYLREIKKLKYNTISEYEKDVKTIITGENGYYTKFLSKIKEENNINDKTPIITDKNGENFYIWTTKKHSNILLLNTSTNTKPEIIKYKISNIRYYRKDTSTKNMILNTDMDILIFKEESQLIFEDLIPEKKFENLKTFNPSDYINDFELFMHKQKSLINDTPYIEDDKLNNSSTFLVISILTTIILLIIKSWLSNITITITSILVILIFIYNFQNIISCKKYHQKNNEEILNILSRDNEVIERFNELKISLGIKDKYENIYNNEGIRYQVWNTNGYFHIFLNEIYFNVLYMVIKTKDVKYFKQEDDICIIKLKNKTIEFRKDAIQTLEKLLPNKNFESVKNFKN